MIDENRLVPLLIAPRVSDDVQQIIRMLLEDIESPSVEVFGDDEARSGIDPRIFRAYAGGRQR
mgnify:CR=1 FL=1